MSRKPRFVLHGESRGRIKGADHLKLTTIRKTYQMF